jgi:hypothetical protein
LKQLDVQRARTIGCPFTGAVPDPASRRGTNVTRDIEVVPLQRRRAHNGVFANR